MSYFGWLDTSEQERRKVMDVIDLFQQKDTVDELGVSSIRDAIADRITPGTSTIQTRARYFFFVPWIYLDIERRCVTADRVASVARTLEVNLIASLASSEDSAGTIGIQAGPALRRLPSAVYWAGLKRLGIRLFDGPQERYHRLFESLTSSKNAGHDDAGAPPEAPGWNWNPHLPDVPREFPKGVSMALTNEEATFLADRFALHANDTLLHFLVTSLDCGEAAEFPWEHEHLLSMPAELQCWLAHGRCYSESMHGSALLYNLMLAEKRRDEALVEGFREWIGEWAEVIRAREAVLREWSLAEFWSLIRSQNPRVPVPAQDFSNQWIRAVQATNDPIALIDDPNIRQLIAGREQRLKGPRARLFSQAHLDVWGGASGTGRMDYRWGITRTIARDVLTGLGALS